MIVAIITICEATKPVKLWHKITATAVLVLVVVVVVVVVATVATVAAATAAVDKSKPSNRGGFMSSFGVFFLFDLVLVLAHRATPRRGQRQTL